MSHTALEVVIGEDAVERLAARVRGPALAVMDGNTKEAAGAHVVSALTDAQPLVFEHRSGLVPSPEAVDRVRAFLEGQGALDEAIDVMLRPSE